MFYKEHSVLAGFIERCWVHTTSPRLLLILSFTMQARIKTIQEERNTIESQLKLTTADLNNLKQRETQLHTEKVLFYC